MYNRSHADVGKSSMLVKYIKGEFSNEYNVTVGVEFNSKTVEINEKTSVMLQVWDTVPIKLCRPASKPLRQL
jgi:GTPase SAR1 family protein